MKQRVTSKRFSMARTRKPNNSIPVEAVSRGKIVTANTVSEFAAAIDPIAESLSELVVQCSAYTLNSFHQFFSIFPSTSEFQQKIFVHFRSLCSGVFARDGTRPAVLFRSFDLEGRTACQRKSFLVYPIKHRIPRRQDRIGFPVSSLPFRDFCSVVARPLVD